MPIDEEVLGFSNRWYPDAIETAGTRSIAGSDIRLVTSVYTKRCGTRFRRDQARGVNGRGAGDVARSHDLEDIVAVVDGRPELGGEIAAARSDVRSYVAAEIGSLLTDMDFIEALSGFLLPDSASQARRPLLEDRFRALAAL